jgi:predicted alpha/beta-fold hydrolase
VLTSVDDPVVPAADFADLPDNPDLELIIAPYGGHCGFIKNWKLESLSEDLIMRRFLEACPS